jgi:predicted PurR-regulated permease PerM
MNFNEQKVKELFSILSIIFGLFLTIIISQMLIICVLVSNLWEYGTNRLRPYSWVLGILIISLAFIPFIGILLSIPYFIFTLCKNEVWNAQ